MLQRIRDKVSGWFAGVFLGAIAIVFIFWGIQFESTVTSGAATVNGEEIPAEAVRRAWQDRQSELQQLTRNELPEELVKREQQRLLEEFIQRELLVQRAHELGYRVSDRRMVDALAQIEALQVDGKFSPDRYKGLLRAQGRSEAEFEREFRRDLEIAQLRNSIGVSSFVTPGELRRRVELEGEARDIDYVTIPSAKYAAGVQVTPQQVADWYAKHAAEYQTPETVALQYLRLDLADVAASVTVTDEALRRFYEQVAAERYVDTERRRASHILIEAGADDAAALAKANDVLARAKAGEDFAKLATGFSDDPGSKAQGGDLGWATRESFVQPFAEALFTMQKGEIRGPVKTQFGYHIIRLDDVSPAHQRTFEEVRAELEADYRSEQARSLFYEKSQQLADESFAALSELDTVAQKLGLPLQSVAGFTRQGGGPFGADRKVIDAVFSDEVLQERRNSPALDLGEESVVVLRVTDHAPSAPRPIDAVRGEIESVLRRQAAHDAAQAAATTAAASVAGGAAIADVARSLGLEPAGAATLTRGSDAVPAELVKAAFAASRPGAGTIPTGTASLPDGDVAMFVVKSVRSGSPDDAGSASKSADIMEQAQGQAALAEYSAYVAELERKARITRNARIFE